ncbi:MAG: CoA transferase [Azospirillaceae bacterium]
MASPLTGLRVLDLTTVLMGPYATQMLSDMGADVIKLEPITGDTSRHVGPGRHPDMGSNFLHMNRGKRSIAVDLKTPAGHAIAVDLIASSDVMVHNIRAVAMERLGLGREAAQAINPRLVYCHLVGYAENGSRAGQPAYDDLIQAAVGFPWLISRTTGEPGYVPTAIADRTAGLCAAFSIASALVGRERNEEGQALTIPMYDVLAHMVLSDHMYGATFIPPEGSVGYERLMSSHRKPYATRDGYVCLLIYTDAHWRRFFALTGRADLVDDPRFVEMRSRNRHIDALNKIVAEILARRSTDEWLALLGDADIPATRMQSVDDLVADPDLRRSGTVAEVDHPSEGRINVLNSPIKWHDQAETGERFAPRLGEHSAELLDELGYGRQRISQLARDGVVVIEKDSLNG